MYLIIFEDGSFRQSASLPDRCEENIADGVLDVLREQIGGFEYRRNHSWHPVIRGE